MSKQDWSAERYATAGTFVPALGVPVLDAFCEAFLAALPQPDRARAHAETADLLRPMPMGEDGCWIADYVRLRFRARLPR